MADESGLIRNRRYIVWVAEKASLKKPATEPSYAIKCFRVWNVKLFHHSECATMYSIHLKPSGLKMEAVWSSETLTLVSTCKTSRRSNPEDRHPHLRRRGNLKYQINMIFSLNLTKIFSKCLLCLFRTAFFFLYFLQIQIYYCRYKSMATQLITLHVISSVITLYLVKHKV
jgi:hypothetical protein